MVSWCERRSIGREPRGISVRGWYIDGGQLADRNSHYRDQLHLAEQHLGSLLSGANTALQLLSGLSNNFKAVEAQTTAFQGQCEDLLNDQKRTMKLADGIAENLQYYTYLDPMTRRLNAPGAGRLVGGKEFTYMLSNLDACLEYMQAHARGSHSEETPLLTFHSRTIANPPATDQDTDSF